jgi:hypothetical protein
MFIALEMCGQTRVRGLYLLHFIFIVTYKQAQKARVLHFTWLESHATEKHSSLLYPLVSYKENEVL